MATFRKRGTKWQVQIRRDGHPPLSRTFTLKSDAEAWARQTEAALERGELSVASRSLREITLLSLLEKYAEAVTPQKKGRSAEKYLLRNIMGHRVAELCLDRLTPSAVAAYRDERLKLVSPSSVRRELAILQHCIEIAGRDWGIKLPKNPVAEITKPSQNRPRERRIAHDELSRIHGALRYAKNPLLEKIIYFAIHTGMRRGEILSIRWKDINWDARTAYLADTKNGHSRSVPLTHQALAAIPSKPTTAKDTDRVFPISPNAVRLAWERLKRRANISDFRFHDLRHEAISRFFELGLSVPEVSLISGHRDPRMLARYTHLKAEDLAKKLEKLS
jgi:integrase